jgi:hypothetical protein
LAGLSRAPGQHARQRQFQRFIAGGGRRQRNPIHARTELDTRRQQQVFLAAAVHQFITRRPVGHHGIPVGAAHQPLHLVERTASRIGAAHHAAHAGADHDIDWHAQLLQSAQHADVGEAARTATRQHQRHFRARLERCIGTELAACTPSCATAEWSRLESKRPQQKAAARVREISIEGLLQSVEAGNGGDRAGVLAEFAGCAGGLALPALAAGAWAQPAAAMGPASCWQQHRWPVRCASGRRLPTAPHISPALP